MDDPLLEMAVSHWRGELEERRQAYRGRAETNTDRTFTFDGAVLQHTLDGDDAPK